MAGTGARDRHAALPAFEAAVLEHFIESETLAGERHVGAGRIATWTAALHAADASEPEDPAAPYPAFSFDRNVWNGADGPRVLVVHLEHETHTTEEVVPGHEASLVTFAVPCTCEDGSPVQGCACNVGLREHVFHFCYACVSAETWREGAAGIVAGQYRPESDPGPPEWCIPCSFMEDNGDFTRHFDRNGGNFVAAVSSLLEEKSRGLFVLISVTAVRTSRRGLVSAGEVIFGDWSPHPIDAGDQDQIRVTLLLDELRSKTLEQCRAVPETREAVCTLLTLQFETERQMHLRCPYCCPTKEDRKKMRKEFHSTTACGKGVPDKIVGVFWVVPEDLPAAYVDSYEWVDDRDRRDECIRAMLLSRGKPDLERGPGAVSSRAGCCLAEQLQGDPAYDADTFDGSTVHPERIEVLTRENVVRIVAGAPALNEVGEQIEARQNQRRQTSGSLLRAMADGPPGARRDPGSIDRSFIHDQVFFLLTNVAWHQAGSVSCHV